MHKKSLPLEYKLIFLCARLEIKSSVQQEIKLLLSNALDWNKIIEFSIRQETLPFLYYNLTRLNLQALIPEDTFLIMKGSYYANLKRNFIFEKEISLLLELADRQGINIIPWKGFALMQTLYPNPGLRIMVDVDILIKKNEFQKIKNILIQLGYQEDIGETNKKQRNDYRHLAIFSKNLPSNLRLFLEIHAMLAFPRPYEIRIPHLWERAYPKTINSQRILCLSQEDNFLLLALHLRNHTRLLTLKLIVDIAELLNINAKELDWAYIKSLARSNHIMTTVYISLYLAKELLEANVSSEILNEFQPNIIKASLICFNINQYNFLTLKKWQGIFLRILFFDRLINLIFYLLRAYFLERFLFKYFFKETKESIVRITPVNISERIKK